MTDRCLLVEVPSTSWRLKPLLHNNNDIFISFRLSRTLITVAFNYTIQYSMSLGNNMVFVAHIMFSVRLLLQHLD